LVLTLIPCAYVAYTRIQSISVSNSYLFRLLVFALTWLTMVSPSPGLSPFTFTQRSSNSHTVSGYPRPPTHWTYASQGTAYSCPAPSTLSATGSSPSTRRFHPYDQSGRQPRQGKQASKSFRCGITGHVSATCDAKSSTMSGSLVDGTSGQSFCFSWANSSACRFRDRCRNIHRCSLCGDGGHGANTCQK
jgi:hypothetical protein